VEVFDSREARLVLAMAIGLLIGSERERRRSEADYAAFAGIRTFGLIGLLGGLLAYVGGAPLLATGTAGIALMACVAYVIHCDRADRGLTTEVAMIVTFALGVVAEQSPGTAASIGVLVTVVLASRGALHRAVRELITPTELRDALLFLVFALVLLPLAPDLHVGPYGALHPPSLIRLVVLLMLTNGLGHVAQRILGPKHGMLVAGLAGGFVSSSATIAAMSMRAKESPENYRRPLGGALASCVATNVQYLLLVAAVDWRLMRALLPGLALSGVAALVLALAFSRRSGVVDGLTGAPDRPFSLRAALLFVAIYCVVAVGSAALHARLGTSGALLVSALGGLLDAHSTAGPIAAMHTSGALAVRAAVITSLAALSTNTLTKIVLAWSGGHVRFGILTSVGVVLTVACAWSTLLMHATP
jgi:uncharacterized membrane protein (DUF4010 family)